jgi:peptidoglycan/LPS O-acetylase OafA/YrhL
MQQTHVKAKGIEFNLEALRGACAFFVVIYHVVLHKQYVDPGFFPRWMKAFNISGHFCVLIFFVLSGYVIGISNPGRLSADKVVPYLKKRFIRIYPIYFICLTVALLFAIPYPLKVIAANYAVLQGLVGPVVWENNPLWSLNYEIVYYLLFIPLSFFNVKPIVALIGAIAVGLINYLLFPAIYTPIVSAYSYGFAFWAAGWCMAAYLRGRETALNPQRLLSGIFLLLSQPFIIVFYYPFKLISKITHNALHYPDVVYWAENMVTLDDFAMMPYCFLLVTLFSGINFRYKKQFFAVLYLIPIISLALLLKNYHGLESIGDKIVPIFCYITSLVLYFGPDTLLSNVSSKIINMGFWLGSVSYGLYVIHFPIMVIFGKVGMFSGSTITFIIRLFAFIATCLVAAYILEKKIQPWVGGKLRNILLPSSVNAASKTK